MQDCEFEICKVIVVGINLLTQDRVELVSPILLRGISMISLIYLPMSPLDFNSSPKSSISIIIKLIFKYGILQVKKGSDLSIKYSTKMLGEVLLSLVSMIKTPS